jgi:hypothetical protein
MENQKLEIYLYLVKERINGTVAGEFSVSFLWIFSLCGPGFEAETITMFFFRELFEFSDDSPV